MGEDTGGGDGWGVRILAVVKDFCGRGERITLGSEVIVSVSLVCREWAVRRFGLLVEPFEVERDSDLRGSSGGGASSGGVCGVRGDRT